MRARVVHVEYRATMDREDARAKEHILIRDEAQASASQTDRAFPASRPWERWRCTREQSSSSSRRGYTVLRVAFNVAFIVYGSRAAS
jgi:hypothetical protein